VGSTDPIMFSTWPTIATVLSQVCRVCKMCRHFSTKSVSLYMYLFFSLSTLFKNTCTPCTVAIKHYKTTLYSVQALVFCLHTACTNWVCLHSMEPKNREIRRHPGLGEDCLHTSWGCLHTACTKSAPTVRTMDPHSSPLEAEQKTSNQ